MKSLWNPADYRELRSRIDRLTPDTVARWGTMTSSQVVCHLADALRMVSGDLPVAPKKQPIRFAPLKQLIIYWLPFPKGVPTAPELLARRPAQWNDELDALRRELDAVAQRGRSGPFTPHPIFGKLTPRAWGVLIYRHNDHHLRQFGL